MKGRYLEMNCSEELSYKNNSLVGHFLLENVSIKGCTELLTLTSKSIFPIISYLTSIAKSTRVQFFGIIMSRKELSINILHLALECVSNQKQLLFI